MSEAQQSAVEVIKRFLDATVKNDWDAVADTYAEDAVVEIPFAPPGVPVTTQGREVLLARFQGAAKIFHFTGADEVTISQSTDPEVVFVEYQLQGNVVPTGKAFSFRYIMKVTVRHGKIVHSRDYSNPLASAVALDRVEALLSALTGEQNG